MPKVTQWWVSRVPITGKQLRELTNEPVPNHLKRWWFCLGGTPAYLFVVQVITGVLLAFYYQPTAEAAYGSVDFITREVTYGWFFRSLHKWAATFMIAAVILHQTRVYFTAAYRAPREINWMVGMGLLLCTLGLGFTGYSLVFEQLSYWGATVGANLCEVIPWVGPLMKQLLLGGEAYSSRTLPRFYVLHAAVLPTMLLVLMGIHIVLIRLHGITELKFEGESKDEPGHFDFFPDHLYTELIVGLVLMVVLTTLAVVQPAGLGPEADPLNTPLVIKPEWFFYVTFRWLKLFSVTAAVLSLGLIVCAMFLWPWIDAAIRRITRREDCNVWIGIIVSLTIIGMTVWEAVVAH
jgi:quinol-cytochrome oxidoreductase complex cytochrome b subunit